MTAGHRDSSEIDRAARGATSAPPVAAAPDVSRGTPGPPELSAEARELLGDSLVALTSYVELLAGPGVERGLIGPRESPRLWTRHVLNCAVVAPLIAPDAAVDDVGSGAGLPGMVLALVRPDLEVTLVEPLLRRATFLTEVVDRLAVGNVRVERIRAEDAVRAVNSGSRAARDVVTARAVAPLDRLAGWCLPLLKEGGTLLAVKGSTAQAEVDASAVVLRAAGARSVEVIAVGEGIVDPPTTVVRVTTGGRPSTGRGRRR